jgi:hypothetical protein
MEELKRNRIVFFANLKGQWKGQIKQETDD